MKLKKGKCLVLLSVMLLCACDSEESRFDAARTRALQNPDPWQAYVQLSADAERDCPSGLLESACSGKTLADYRGLAQTLYRKALSRSSPGAFADLFLRSVPPGRLEPQMPELAKKLIVMAGESPGDRASAALLLAAGDVLQKGEWVQKDSVQAAAFYARAWLAGSAKAASRLSHLYSLQHDDASALLWQNRCTGECYPGQELVDVPDSWSPRKILRIQALAKDRSIVTVNGQADWEDK
ncbi:hypothetical protein [Pantoea sp. OXWO6B1]|uniref:hypothetical protein n=1 Tax=Pantoea sp. OXWO6B1 TaxID=1835724 RepID=UPI0007C81C7C|nr:hypothetical protein [Pantoea sp. OXWO6B1]OAD97937.1 hypothetical protein A6A26_23525 [Pantoea sp. OXWO6B1]